MKSFKKNFEKIQKRNFGWSSYACFIETVRSKSFSEKMIRYWFYKLVDKSDYLKNEARDLLRYLVYLSKHAEEGMK